MSKPTRLARAAAMATLLALGAAACGTADETAESVDTTVPDDGEERELPELPDADCDEAGDGDDAVVIRGLFPETGSLAFLGPPEFAGAELAAIDINAAGGARGFCVDVESGDSGDTTTDIANQTVDKFLDDNADAVIGAASSSVSLTVIDKITGAGVIHFSPANTSPVFTDYDDNDLYFRTAPSDVLQGRVLADLMIAEGNESATLIALQDPYGEGLLDFTAEPFANGGGTVDDKIIYDPQAANFDSEVDDLVEAASDAIVVIGFDETAKLLTTMFEKGLTPDEVNIYLVDGNIGNALGEKFEDEGVLTGIKGTAPGTELTGEFQDRILAVDDGVVDYTYAAETYDAIVITALAAAVADSDDPEDWAAEINDVTRGGEKCTSYADCLALIDEGEDIDYDGVGGPYEFGDAGEPTEASFSISSYGDDNRIDAALTEFRFAEL